MENSSAAKVTHKRIALIEDNPFWQHQFRQHLKAIDRNIEVTILSTAEEFTSQNEPPESFDLIISDHLLGTGKTGFALWRDLRDKKCKVPFALTSGMGKGQIQALTSTEKESPAFIGKPYRFDDFRVKVGQLLKKPQNAAPAAHPIPEMEWTVGKDVQQIAMTLMIFAFFAFLFVLIVHDVRRMMN